MFCSSSRGIESCKSSGKFAIAPHYHNHATWSWYSPLGHCPTCCTSKTALRQPALAAIVIGSSWSSCQRSTRFSSITPFGMPYYGSANGIDPILFFLQHRKQSILHLPDPGRVHCCNRWYIALKQLNLHSCLIAEASMHQAVPEPWAQNKSIDTIDARDCRLRLQRLAAVWCITCI